MLKDQILTTLPLFAMVIYICHAIYQPEIPHTDLLVCLRCVCVSHTNIVSLIRLVHYSHCIALRVLRLSAFNYIQHHWFVGLHGLELRKQTQFLRTTAEKILCMSVSLITVYSMASSFNKAPVERFPRHNNKLNIFCV